MVTVRPKNNEVAGKWRPHCAGTTGCGAGFSRPFLSHRTSAVTRAAPFSVNVHVLVLLPPLEQAPDQMTSRPFVASRVIDVPTVNDADPVLPTATLIPEGVDVTRSPLRPVAVTVSVAV